MNCFARIGLVFGKRRPVWAARALPRRRQGRIHLAYISVQLRPVALHRASFLTSLSPLALGARKFPPRRQNDPGRFEPTRGATAGVAGAQSGNWFAHSWLNFR